MALVTCTPGYDGGLNQTFTLEVREYKNVNVLPAASIRNAPIPLFNVRNLKHGEEYLFIIIATNNKGTSSPVTLTYAVPTSTSSKLASNSYDGSQMTWISWTLFLAIVFGVFTTICVVFCIAIFMIKIKSVPRAKNSAKIIYAGPIRDYQENGIYETIHPPSIIHCDKGLCWQIDILPSHIFTSNFKL